MTDHAGSVDYAHTRGAEYNRVKKARTLARWLWDRGVTPEDVHAAAPATRRGWAQQAGVTPPRTDETWLAAAAAIDVLEQWAVDNPDHPKAKPAHLPPPADPDSHVPPAPPGSWPKGWASLADAAPITRFGAVCARCDQPPVTVVHCLNGDQWRCINHPPLPGEWGAELDWSLGPVDDLRFHPDHPHRCYSARCPHFTPTTRTEKATLP